MMLGDMLVWTCQRSQQNLHATPPHLEPVGLVVGQACYILSAATHHAEGLGHGEVSAPQLVNHVSRQRVIEAI